jgi:hypothetical protein
MSPADQPAPSPDGGWLNPDEQRAWLACIRVQLRLTGLVRCAPAPADRCATEVSFTGEGRRALIQAAPGHVELVRKLFFTGLPARLLDDISTAFEIIYGNIVRFGSLPAPHEPHGTLTYGFANCQQMPGSRAYNFPVQAAA